MKIRKAMHYRPEMVKKLFSKELFGVAQSIAQTSKTLYHGQKSDILKKFPSHPSITLSEKSGIIHDLSVLTKSQTIGKEKTFSDFANSIYERIMAKSKNFSRCCKEKRISC